MNNNNEEKYVKRWYNYLFGSSMREMFENWCIGFVVVMVINWLSK